MKNRELKLPQLADAELAVMELLWRHDCLTARDIREQLHGGATTSLHGTVQRLKEKGLVERDSTLAVHLFSALISCRAYAGGQLESLAAKLTGGSLAPLVTHLLEEKKISSEEIQRLRQIFDVGTDVGGRA